MEIKCCVTDTKTDGAVLLPCELKSDDTLLIIRVAKLGMELRVPLEAVHIVMADELHG